MTTETLDHETPPSTAPAPSSAEQRFMYEELAKRIDKTEELIEKVKSKAKDDIQKESATLQATLKAEYSSKIEAVKAQADSFDGFLKVAKFIIVLLASGFVVIGFIVGKNAKDMREDAQSLTRQLFTESIQKQTQFGKDITTLIKEINSYISSIDTIKQKLSGYAALSDTIDGASNFDPLVLYYHLDEMIDKLEEEETVTDKDSKGNVVTYSSTKDVAFRQYAAVVFDRLIKSLEEDEKNKISRINPDELYNIAANASKIDMDFVSLRVMGLASTLTQRNRPEVEARLLRHKVATGAVSFDAAIAELRKILATANGLTLHLVVSEAFNLGIHTQSPEKVSEILGTDLPPKLQTTSYVLLNRGQLLMLAGLPEEWENGLTLFRKGLNALEKEAPLARWYEYSWITIQKMIRRDTALLNIARQDISSTLEKTKKAQGGGLSDPAKSVERALSPSKDSQINQEDILRSLMGIQKLMKEQGK